MKQLKQFYEAHIVHAAAHHVKAINREREQGMDRMAVSTFWAQHPPPTLTLTPPYDLYSRRQESNAIIPNLEDAEKDWTIDLYYTYIGD